MVSTSRMTYSTCWLVHTEAERITEFSRFISIKFARSVSVRAPPPLQPSSWAANSVHLCAGPTTCVARIRSPIMAASPICGRT